MNGDWLRVVEQLLIGTRCKMHRRDFDWALEIIGGGSLSIYGLWRIVADGRVALTSGDDGQQFGLPKQVDGEVEANRLIDSLPITALLIANDTADLSLHFGSDLRLEVLCHSFAYEAWQYSPPSRSGGVSVVATGGGGIAIF